MPGAVAGSWFPSGFHGHFRSHSRNDFYQEYRQEARPHPPHAFIERIKEHPTKHTFSRHDNRHIFPSCVFSFENGLGKRKPMKTRESNDFIQWIPLEDELKKQRPLVSTYRTDFWKREGDETEFKIPQLLAPRLRLLSSPSFPQTTAYRQTLRSHQPRLSVTMDKTDSFNQRSPSKAISCDFVNGGSELTRMRARSAPSKHLTVSDCLVWTTPENKSQTTPQNSETA
ncbi:uncharacterized protein C3orf84 homolog [Spea bombifrons]|uniref:uncharacterized protein C3orf84 homolog n=1 Tax=Spea bombifrons TaxID=233779 RepID=UPI002349E946|nr:uncharacterized protein C3orf84 homolog [Spea bombifrons]